MCLNQVVEDPEQDQDESLGPEKAWIMRSRVLCSLHHPIVFRVASSPLQAAPPSTRAKTLRWQRGREASEGGEKLGLI